MLTTTWTRHRKFKKKSEKWKISAHRHFMWPSFEKKQQTWTTAIILKKPFSELTYRVRSSMAFNPNELGHGLNHAIVCLNEPVLCTCVRIGMANNVANWSFHFLCTKNALFIFRVPEMGDFKHLSFHRLIIAPAQFSKILGHFMCTIHHASEPVAFLRSGREKDTFLPIH